jgi:hypothetical protein
MSEQHWAQIGRKARQRLRMDAKIIRTKETWHNRNEFTHERWYDDGSYARNDGTIVTDYPNGQVDLFIRIFDVHGNEVGAQQLFDAMPLKGRPAK